MKSKSVALNILPAKRGPSDGMPLSLSSIFLGFLLGVAATAIAWHFSTRFVRNPERTKVTAVWSLEDLTEPGTRPAIIAERVAGLKIPGNAKVIVPAGTLNAVPPEVLATCEVRMHPEVRVNAAIGKDRAILFSGRVSPTSTAVLTINEDIVRRLQNDFARMWGQSTPFVEETAIAELSNKIGRIVDVKGRALEVLEYRGRKMLRITDGKLSVGVVTKQRDVAEFQGGNVRVVGRMHRDGAYPFIEADQVQLVEGSPVPMVA